MTTAAYYNEINPEAAHVIRCLIRDGVVAPGEVDTRSIKDVQPDDLRGFSQLHFFAGGALWSVAARLAGWPDDKPLWTGSCPCQGESLAGKRLGADDPRHLWPDLYRLIRARRPPVVVGEQVAAAAGTHWLDGVCADLANENYAARAVDIPACSVDAPHQRQRLYWIAVDDGDDARLEGQRRDDAGQSGRHAEAGSIAAADGELLAQPDEFNGRTRAGRGDRAEAGDAHGCNGSNWADAEWIVSPLDGKARRSKPGFCNVADGVSGGRDGGNFARSGGFGNSQIPYSFLVKDMPGRAHAWRIAGNAIVPVLAAEVLRAFLETEDCS